MLAHHNAVQAAVPQRKELPHASETPTEIEIEAGLADNAAMQDLHVRYEEARYGRGV